MATHVTSQTGEPSGSINSLVQSNFDQTATDLFVIMAKSQLNGALKQNYGGLLRTTCSRSKAIAPSCSAKPRNNMERKGCARNSPLHEYDEKERADAMIHALVALHARAPRIRDCS
jgi:hypothetical protein